MGGTRLRKIALGGGFAVMSVALVAALALGGLYAYLRSESGRGFVASLIEGAVSDETVRLAIGGIDGDLLSEFTLRDIEVSDGGGVFLTADRVAVSWRPSWLLGGAVEIAAVEVGRLAIDRIPQPDAGGEGSSASLPPLSLAVRRLAVAEIALAPPVAGEAQRLSLLGALSAAPGLAGAKVDLDLKRIDGAPGRGRLALDYAAGQPRFAARLSVEEPRGGLVARLAGLPAGTGLKIDLKGEGPPDAWRGRIVASAGTRADADFAVTVSIGPGGMAVGLDGRVDAAGLAPEELAPLAAGPFDVSAVLKSDLHGALSVESARAGNRAVELSGQMRLAADGTVEAAASAALADGTPRVPGLDGVSVGRTTLSATLAGTIAEPRLTAELTAAKISAFGAGAGTLRGRLEATPVRGGAWDMEGRFTLSGVAPPPDFPAGLVGAELSAHVRATALPDGDSPILLVDLAGGPLRASFDGAFAGAELDGRYTFALADLAPLARGQGIAVGGALEASGDISADTRTGAVSLTAGGDVTGLSGIDTALLDVLGRRAGFAFDLTTEDWDALVVSGLSVELAAGRMTGAGTLRLGSGRIDGQVAAEIPDASVFSSLVGRDIAGRLRATGSVEGALAAPAIAARVTADAARVDDMALGTLGVGIGARIGEDGLAARLHATGRAAGREIEARADLTLRGDTLEARDAVVTAGSARITGTLRADLARARLSGEADAKVLDLAELSDLAGVRLSGAAAARLRLVDGERQQVSVDATAEGLRASLGPGIAAERATLAATITDPFGRPALSANLEAGPIAAGSATATRAKATVRGWRDKLDWSFEGEGTWREDIRLSAAGDLALTEGGGRLAVQRLDGGYGSVPILLAAPATVAWQGDDVKAGPVDLTLASGRVTGRLALVGDTVDAEARIAALPARLVALVAPNVDLDGTVSGRLRASGPRARPELDGEIAVSGLRPAASGETDDGVELRATLRQTGGRLELAGSARGPDELSASLELAVAQAVGFGDAGPMIDDGAALSGRLRASANLALVDRLVGLGADRLAGRLESDVAIGGTAGAPTLSGEARLAGGAYEGASTGVVVRSVDAVVALDGPTARIVSLTGRDGGAGRLSGSGVISLSAEGGPDDRLTVRLDQFTALRRPEATLTLSGDLAAAGPPAAPALTGSLTVERGEIRIPERLPESVVELDVVEINKPAPPPGAAGRAEPSASRALAARLDVGIKAPGRVFVRGRGLDTELQGELRVTGTTAAPQVRGQLSIVRGTFAFAGHTFALSKGTLTFPEDGPPDPEIDLEARADLSGLVAIAHITGTPSKIDIAVTSEPEMPQEEVLSRILFGRSAGQLSPIQAAQLARTAASLSGRGGPDIVDRIRQTLGVDVLSVEADGEGGKGASLKAGKYLNDDVFLSVRQGTEPGSQRVGVEVEVMPNVTVESDVGGAGQTGLGINWKWDY